VLKSALLMIAVMTLLTGVIYPAVTFLAGQAFFPDQANGSLVKRDDVVVGSEMIGQQFLGRPGYFWGRPSAAGDGYDGSASSGSNLGPTSAVLLERIANLTAQIQSAHPERSGVPIPVDLITASGSGLDPHITPAAAEYQVPRVARERGLTAAAVRTLVAEHTSGRTLGLLGEPTVNVLLLNLALDDLATRSGR
jgi:K+-transporting ATPase ATPase C chain